MTTLRPDSFHGMRAANARPGLGAAARALRSVCLLPVIARSADRLRLLHGSDGRPSFPYIATRRRNCYQVLLYHRVHDSASPYFPGVPVARFRHQMRLLAESWNVRPLGELVRAASVNEVPPRSIAITFDDGYADNYAHAFPILRGFELPATIFLTTGPLESGTPLWHDRVFDAFDGFDSAVLTLEGDAFPMGGPDLRRQTLRKVLALLRSRPAAERDCLVQTIADQSGSSDRPSPTSRMLAWGQIREMVTGGIEFGAHTVTHPILSRMPLQDAVQEILASRDAIERRLAVRVKLFAYPNGSQEDFDSNIKGALREHGFLAAATTLWGSNDSSTDPFELRRIGLWDADPEMLTLRLAWYRFAS